MSSASAEMNSKKAESEKTITLLVYALQAASFLFVITFLIAVVINYVTQVSAFKVCKKVLLS
ncbi:MAG: hypothetical protein KZQ89_05330 [Candidatus Thiodiazotropha sp. (ex Lucinoma kastoroae)]|nr:hypothetical protein [Candidatus Thiodiazotropha sp. (ex Lucinoma kastoroae)]MCU7860476.1 hypothetical protein [Candidatus Thiodiazotropha sp. (ex Lucinoma kastoroae)]